ncbi:hypothetical protein EV686_1165 [Paracandidimonas soli]|uniref:Uncharacterized protein n=1 Tax=Paracandidimonas soli TaxID=1917182 RepID=A0A4R3UJT4_9BURK|nr:hypothetical protein EV686_1165 [Paracandidimonas soli]
MKISVGVTTDTLAAEIFTRAVTQKPPATNNVKERVLLYLLQHLSKVLHENPYKTYGKYFG